MVFQQKEAFNFAHSLNRRKYFLMELELVSLNSDELVKLYHQVNAELAKQLLNGFSLNEQQERIGTLSRISKHLPQRKITVKNKRFESFNHNRSEVRKTPNNYS